ncbi:MAG: hypothetical protein WD016_11565 [Balneolaceae bacterium]
MSRSRYKFHEEHYPYFVTSTILEELPLLSKPQIAEIVLDQFIFMQQNKAVTLYAYILREIIFMLWCKEKILQTALGLQNPTPPEKF